RVRREKLWRFDEMAEQHISQAAVGHETTDAPIRPIVLVGGAITIVCAIAFAISLGVFRFFSERPADLPPNPMAREAPAAPPSPRIQVAPAIEYQQLRLQEDQTLTTYGWVDRKKGVARIPIDRAIDLLLERGLPVRQEGSKK